MSEVESNEYIARQNQVRQAWVKEASTEMRSEFSAMPQEERFQHYAAIDKKVNQAYRANVAKLRETKPRPNQADLDSAMTQAAKAVIIELLN